MALKSGIVGTDATKSADAVLTTSPVKGPVAFNDPNAAPTPTPWTLEGDPNYQASLLAGKSQFNQNQFNAQADIQNQQSDLAQQQADLARNAAINRKQLAGNYAARGMAGGAGGALTYAEAEANARQLAAQTSITDQIASLNRNYVSNYGAAGTDWQGTLQGQNIVNQARQQAIQARLQAIGANQ
jgi:hypothetical protein